MVFPGVQKTTWTLDKRAHAYYFHRFYEFQPDLNVANPAVREEIERIMGFWLQLGVTGFRIDAAPFIIEDKRSNAGSGPEQYEYLTDFRRFLSWRRGDAMTLAEANVAARDAELLRHRRPHEHAVQLLGQSAPVPAVAREERRPAQGVRQLPRLPPTAQWANFLRNNDELDLGRLTDEDRRLFRGICA